MSLMALTMLSSQLCLMPLILWSSWRRSPLGFWFFSSSLLIITATEERTGETTVALGDAAVDDAAVNALVVGDSSEEN